MAFAIYLVIMSQAKRNRIKEETQHEGSGLGEAPTKKVKQESAGSDAVNILTKEEEGVESARIKQDPDEEVQMKKEDAGSLASSNDEESKDANEALTEEGGKRAHIKRDPDEEVQVKKEDTEALTSSSEEESKQVNDTFTEKGHIKRDPNEEVQVKKEDTEILTSSDEEGSKDVDVALTEKGRKSPRTKHDPDEKEDTRETPASSGGDGGDVKDTNGVAQIITLSQLLDEKGMQASRDYNKAGGWIGKGPRNERELLRFYAKAKQIAHKEKSWEWSTTDPDLPVVRKILDRYKGGTRAPSRKKWNALKDARSSGSPAWEDYDVH